MIELNQKRQYSEALAGLQPISMAKSQGVLSKSEMRNIQEKTLLLIHAVLPDSDFSIARLPGTRETVSILTVLRSKLRVTKRRQAYVIQLTVVNKRCGVR